MRRKNLALGSLLAALAVLGCGGGPSGPSVRAAAATEAPARSGPDPRLREDCGGWEPAPDLVDDAAALGDPRRKPGTLAALESGPLARKIDVLRAGLRLRDEAAARACAARLTWERIDGWECARCVELLTGDVLRPESEAQFEDVRSYLGGTDVPSFVASLPPTPWDYDTGMAVSQLHRVLRAEHIPLWCRLARHPNPEIARSARSDLESTVLEWNDEHREDVAALWLGLPPEAAEAPAPAGPGLHPLLRGVLGTDRDDLATGEFGRREERIDRWIARWCLASVPGPDDEAVLLSLLDRESAVADAALTLLARLGSDRAIRELRERAERNPIAMDALATTGDPVALARVEAAAADHSEDLAAFMAAAPDRARAWLESRLFGPDDDAAVAVLELLADFATPGAWSSVHGFDFRRTSFAGFAERAATAAMSSSRRAGIGAVVPGCRTRAIAVAACRDLDAAFLASPPIDGSAAFLETAAPDEFRAAVRRIAAGGDADAREEALHVLLAIGDPESAEALVAFRAAEELPFVQLARTRSPLVRSELELHVRASLEADAGADRESAALGALAVFHGLPEGVTFAFEGAPAEAAAAVLDARPVDGLVLALGASLDVLPQRPPGESRDVYAGDLGAVRDPRVKAWLEEVRARRELGSYWYATGELAVMGDPAARAEFLQAMEDGRYRIVDGTEESARTLGWDLEATMPLWISRLRSTCCVVATGASGDLVGNALFGGSLHGSTERTAYTRAKELWDAAEGRFVFSRLDEHWVPAAR